MGAKLIPPQSEPVTLRAQLLAGSLGALVGALFGGAMWFITGDLNWLYAVPICALIAPVAGGYRPHVLWGKRGP